MTDIIQIPGWNATGQYQEGTLLVLQGTYTTQDEACHKCGSIGNLYKHGTKVLRYRDIPFRMAPTVIEGTVQRYRCRDCGETFVQTPNGMDDTRRMTDRCIEFIKQQCIPHTFTHIAELVGCVEGTVRAIAAERFDEFDDLRAKALGRKPRTKIVKPAPIPEGFQRTYPNPWTTEGHQILIEALGSICTSCGGKFADLHTHTIPAILPGQKPKRDYICATCYARFHTKEVGHGNQDSTPKCG